MNADRTPTPAAHPPAPLERYTLLSGQVLEFERPSSDVAAYLAQVQDAARNPNVSEGELTALIYSPDNPIMDATVIPGHGVVTQEVFNNPVYRVMTDLMGHKRIALGVLDMDKAREQYTVTVAEASERLGITPDAVRKAIYADRLSAHKKGGTWYIQPLSIESYKVSDRGPKPKPSTASQALLNGGLGALSARIGSVPGCSFRIKTVQRLEDTQRDGGPLVGTLPEGWSSVGVIINDKTKTSMRFFRLEPSREANELAHQGFYVRGRFEIAEKINNSRLANEAWKAFKPA